MSRSCPAPTRSLATAALVVGALVGACGGSGSDATEVIVRDPDDQQVLTPAEVAALRADTPSADAEGEAGASGDTIPLEEVDPTQRLFDAFSEFNGCMKDGGQPFRGDPRSDPSLMKDTAYLEIIQRCAARSNILGALEASQKANESLTPDQVEERNEQFLVFQECLEKRGWTVVAAPDAKGLLAPSEFASPDGGLNERDMRQCGSEVDTG